MFPCIFEDFIDGVLAYSVLFRIAAQYPGNSRN